MGRRPKGCGVQKGGQWYAQLRVDFEDGGRGPRNFAIEATSKEQADEIARRLQPRTVGKKFPRTGRITLPTKGVTFDHYLERWIADRKRRKFESVKDDEQRLTDHVLPHLKGRTMEEIEGNPELLRVVRKGLSAKVDNPDIKFGWKTARNTWNALSSLFTDASESDDESIRVIRSNPCRLLKPPKRGLKKVKQWLYPREFIRLITCADVPIEWRRAYAVAAYLLLRPSELRALRGEDFDLVTCMVTVKNSTAKDNTTLRPKTKNHSIRQFAMEPEIVPLVRFLISRAGGKGRIFGRHGKAAETFRRHLRKAGIRREELHVPSGRSLPITFHDLRATGITWAAMRGDSVSNIRDRAGHEDVTMTNEYIRRASAVGDVGAPFPPLSPLYPAGLNKVHPMRGTVAYEDGLRPASPGPGIHNARNIARGISTITQTLMKTGSYNERDTGLEPFAASCTSPIPAVSRPTLGEESSQKEAPRDIPRDIRTRPEAAVWGGAGAVRTPSVWALQFAMERLMVVHESRKRIEELEAALRTPLIIMRADRGHADGSGVEAGVRSDAG